MSLSENNHLYKGCLWQPGAVQVHDKSQPSSSLSHPLLLPPSPWQSGESQAPSPSLLSQKGGLTSMDLSADAGFVLCQIMGLLVMGEGSEEKVRNGGKLGLY